MSTAFPLPAPHSEVDGRANLEHAVGDLARQLAAVELGHADLLHGLLLAVEEIAGAVGEPAAGLQLGEELGQLVAPDLERADGSDAVPEALYTPILGPPSPLPV